MLRVFAADSDRLAEGRGGGTLFCDIVVSLYRSHAV